MSTPTNTIRSLIRYPRDILTWLWSIKPLVMIVAAALVLALCIYFFDCLEQRIRIIGMGLQLLGVTVVAIGLNDTRRSFNDLPTLWESIKQAWTVRPRWHHDTRIVGAAQAMGLMMGDARIKIGSAPGASLEQKVTALGKQYDALFDEVGTLSAETKKKFRELDKQIGEETRQRQEGDADVKNHFRKAIGDGIRLQIVGVIFFVLGIVAGSVSPEIAHGLGGAACTQI